MSARMIAVCVSILTGCFGIAQLTSQQAFSACQTGRTKCAREHATYNACREGRLRTANELCLGMILSYVPKLEPYCIYRSEDWLDAACGTAPEPCAIACLSVSYDD